MFKLLIVFLFSITIQGCSSNFNKLEESDGTDINIAIKDIKKACKELADNNSDEFLECFKSNTLKIE